jgi:hypothetical protein
MVNEKETLKKWHKQNPNLTTDELLQLLDGIVENWNWTTQPSTITYKDVPYTVTCK